jgi:hypothetical protein
MLGKGLASAAVNYELWRVPSGVYKWSINAFTNPYPVYSDIPQNRDNLVSEVVECGTALDPDRYIAKLWKWKKLWHACWPQ